MGMPVSVTRTRVGVHRVPFLCSVFSYTLGGRALLYDGG